MILSDAAIKNRTTVGVLIALILVSGAYSYVSLPREAAPDVPIPLILINTHYEGVSPEDVESQVTIKIEKELSGIKGLKEIRSESAEGASSITVEFDPDIVIEDALQRVRDKVDLAKADLPAEADEPVITEINVAEWPIMIVSISGDIAPIRLKEIADEVEDAIEQVPGVLEVDVIGAVEREIRLEVNPDRMAAYNLTFADLISAIPSENVNISVGGLETKGTKFNVRVPAEFVSPAEADELVLAVNDGKPIYLTDIVTVRDTFKDRDTLSRLNGETNVTLNVKKRTGANIIEIADQVKRILREARQKAPAGVRFELTDDQSKDIRMMIQDLENNILTALILVVVVLVLFLGFRTSAIVAMAIPLSMLISMAVIQAIGYTLNMIVLFSLMLALGMLVDNAIVIVENIYRHAQSGCTRVEAAIRGTREVAWPVATSTATTLAAFSPMAFWPGVIGNFMKYLPVTVIIVLSSSLFVALVISPMLASVLISVRPKKHAHPSLLIRGYRRLLGLTLANRLNRLTALFLAGAVLVILAMLYAVAGHGVEFFPDIDPRQGHVTIRSPQGTNILESDRLTRIVEGRVAPLRKEMDFVVANVGGGGAGGLFGGSTGGPHESTVILVFKDYELRERPSAEIVKDIRGRMKDIAGPEIMVSKVKEGPPTGDAVTIRIIGKDFKELERLNKAVQDRLVNVPGLVNLHSDLEAARPELVFMVNRREASLSGVNTAEIGYFLQMAVLGREVGTYHEYNDEYDITLRLPLSQRKDIQNIERLHIPNRFGEAVPICSLGRFQYRGGFGTIHRVDQKRVVTLTGDAAEGELGPAVLERVRARLTPDKLTIPAGYAIRYAGEDEEMQKAKTFLFKAFIIAVLLILLILVTQFNSLIVPLIIMTTVALSQVGVLSGLLICRMPFGVIMTGIGVVSLAGVVVNNAIVLIDYTRQLQKRGLGLIEATVQAGATRFRPILLTAATTILGLLPIATGVSFNFHTLHWALRSESSQWWRNMTVAVMFGLAFATVLALVVVPVLYVSLYRLAARLGLGGIREPAGVPVRSRDDLRPEG